MAVHEPVHEEPVYDELVDAKQGAMDAPSPGLRWYVDRGVLTVVGEVDAASAGAFGAALAECDGDVTVAALDLSTVSFFSAAGVRCFVSHGWTIRAHPMIIASPVVRRVLTVCDVDYLLERHGWAGGSVRLTTNHAPC